MRSSTVSPDVAPASIAAYPPFRMASTKCAITGLSKLPFFRAEKKAASVTEI
jgi:hypothetical protein